MAMTMARNFTSAQRHARRQALQRLAERDADALLLDDLAELAGQRLVAFARDGRQAFVQRQAGFHAAHDDVDGVGELGEELVLAPLR